MPCISMAVRCTVLITGDSLIRSRYRVVVGADLSHEPGEGQRRPAAYVAGPVTGTRARACLPAESAREGLCSAGPEM